MPRRHSPRVWLFPALLLAIPTVPRASDAQWSKLPNGELSFQVDKHATSECPGLKNHRMAATRQQQRSCLGSVAYYRTLI